METDITISQTGETVRAFVIKSPDAASEFVPATCYELNALGGRNSVSDRLDALLTAVAAQIALEAKQ